MFMAILQLIRNNMIEDIIQFDYVLFIDINQIFHCAFLDHVLPFLRIPIVWVPLYLFLILFAAKQFSGEHFLYWVLAFVVVISLCDAISSHVIKSLIYRMRPCYNPLWWGKVRHLTTYCSGTSSFTSSHACNHFGMAIFFYVSLRDYFKRYAVAFFVWAFFVSYAQVYVGVHYPLDIFCGAIIGTTLGFFVSQFYTQLTLQANKNNAERN